ncbi:MAG: aspartate aminotransferase family protein [Bacteroidia bacterium]|nr:aspartate aminotransferase family protein [Bacteroidia bacterium]MBT8286566.1 aspartate aminotransferase family protein [Bacteroidia bacterium]
MKLFDVYKTFDITPVKANGVFVYDESGREYLDFYGGHAVISIGHSHPVYVNSITEQLKRIGFYSNAVINPLQSELAIELAKVSDCINYELFLCNSGAEANENALKLASFHTNRKKIIAFKNGFHGRTSAAVAATDNPKIIAPLNDQHAVEHLDFGDIDQLRTALNKGDCCAVIIECIQGIGGLNEADTNFLSELENLCRKNGTVLIADEVQSGYGRTGQFFSFQKHGIKPDIITMAKGMGNGFPIGGLLIHNSIEAKMGMLGTTFGGNHLACAAAIAVLKVMEQEQLMSHVQELSDYFREQLIRFDGIKAIKGRGLMLGLAFDHPIESLRKQLLDKHFIFTGNAKDPHVLRILPPLTIKKEHIDRFIHALAQEL